MATEKSTAATGFSDAERAAMKDRAAELKAAKGVKGGKKKADEAQACLDKIAELSGADRVRAERIHAIVAQVAPDLDSKTWYGMPAYARDGKVVCFYKPAEKFEMRYATLGFSDVARLDDGTMWASEFALTDLTEADVERITDLISRA